MTAIIITAHAAQRYVERVNPSMTLDQTRVEIASHSAAIRVAAAFGCRCVRTGLGAKLVLDGESVVTVLPRTAVGAVFAPRDHR